MEQSDRDLLENSRKELVNIKGQLNSLGVQVTRLYAKITHPKVASYIKAAFGDFKGLGNSVVTEQTFGLPASSGTSDYGSRDSHTHGTPPDPIPNQATHGGEFLTTNGVLVSWAVVPGATQEGIEDVVGAMVLGNTETGIAVTYDDTNGKLDFDAQTAGDLRYAPIAKGVTGGDSHDHDGGDGAQINHTKLSNIGTNTHTQVDTHLANTSNPHSVTAAQAGAPSLVNPSVVGNFVGFSNITGGQNDSGSKATDFAVAAKGVTGGDTHDHVGGDGAQIDHGGLGGLGDDDHTQYIKHALAIAANDFLVAFGAGAFVKKTLAETLTILGKGAASGLATLDASTVVVEAVKRVLSADTALTTNDGQAQWLTTRKILSVYDTQRERAVSAIGWLPHAYQIGGGPGDIVTTALALATQNDVIALPVILEAHGLLESVTIWQLDTATQRTWRWGLYEQYLNNGLAPENTLTRVVSCIATSFTPTAASNETAAAVPLFYLAPGIYWLVIQNRHASNALTLGTQLAGTMALNTAQTKNIGVNLPATLDFVAATWVKQTCVAGAALNFRVFGQTTAF